MKELNCLLVDDSPIIKNIVKKVLLNKIGVNAVYVANFFEEALEIMNSKKVDMILSNWENPDVTGNKLLFEVRQSRDWKNTPFIILTSNDTKDFFVSALQHGATHCVVIPFAVHELEDVVRKSWNAASKRKAGRFSSLPAHNLSVKASCKPVDAKLINISRCGCLVKTEYHRDLALFGNYELDAEFEMLEEGRKYSVGRLIGTIIRLEKDSSGFDTSTKACLMGLNFNPAEMDKQTVQAVDNMMRWLESLNPETVISHSTTSLL